MKKRSVSGSTLSRPPPRATVLIPHTAGGYYFRKPQRLKIGLTGAKFLTQHGGDDLTTTNGMDVMERFDQVASYAEQTYPEDSEEGKKTRDFFKLCRELAEALSKLLKFMKSQKKCNADEFLKLLDDFLRRWEKAFPDSDYFLKLHHLIAHVAEFIRRYGMFGRVSAEGFEALHVLIAKLKAMSRSQTTLSRINTTNAKSQTALKPGVLETSDKFEKGSKGKKRSRYNTKPSTQSTDAAETLEPYNTVTHEGGEFIEVSGGEAIVWKKADRRNEISFRYGFCTVGIIMP